MSLESSRTTYSSGTLSEATVERDPLLQLRRWLDDAYGAQGAVEANAMSLATASVSGAPSARIVLLRGLDSRGLIFYTSYFSRKGRQIAENPAVAATFYWPGLERQVRIEGRASPLSEDESDAYFESRPRGHRLSAWASEQSEPVERREILEERMTHFDERFGEDDVPRPHSWGGYLIAPSYIEFWQGRPNRVHDRLAFTCERTGWTIERLQP